jgi:hypothetical protein
MPVVIRKQGGKYRLVERDTGSLVKNAQGTPVDGGGHPHSSAAQRQAQAINISQHKKKRSS